jgi:hypothetical protein
MKRKEKKKKKRKEKKRKRKKKEKKRKSEGLTSTTPLCSLSESLTVPQAPGTVEASKMPHVGTLEMRIFLSQVCPSPAASILYFGMKRCWQSCYHSGKKKRHLSLMQSPPLPTLLLNFYSADTRSSKKNQLRTCVFYKNSLCKDCPRHTDWLPKCCTSLRQCVLDCIH